MTIFDMHDHVFPAKISQKAAESIGDFYSYPMSGNGTIDQLLMWHEAAGVGHALIHSVAVAPKNVPAINYFISECVTANPGHCTGFGAIHPDCEDFDEVIREAKACGLKGFKMHPDMQRFALDSPRSMEMFEAIEAAGLPVLIHTGDPRFDFSHPSQMYRVLKHCPKLKCIAAHLGGHREWEEAIELLAPLDNVWVDTSSSLAFLDPAEAVRIIRCYDRERVFFGTDFPMWNTKEELTRFEALPLTDGEKERILSLNAPAFLNSLS